MNFKPPFYKGGFIGASALARCLSFSVRLLSEQACAGSRGEPSVPGRAVTGGVYRSQFGLVGASVRRFARRTFRAVEGCDGAFSVFSLFFVGASVRRDARRIFRAREGGDGGYRSQFRFVGVGGRRGAAPRIFYEILNRNLFRKMRKQDFIFLPKCYLMKLVKIFFSASG